MSSPGLAAPSPPPAPTQVEKQNDTTPPSVRSLKWSHDGSLGGGSFVATGTRDQTRRVAGEDASAAHEIGDERLLLVPSNQTT